MKDTKNMPALVLLGLALVTFVGSLAAFGSSHLNVGTTFAVIAVVLFLASLVWFLIAHLRVRRIEERWYTDHPDAERQRPSS
jgi:membrane protein DedA with SNARE-associated domain